MLHDVFSRTHDDILKEPTVVTTSFNSNALDLRGGLVGAGLQTVIGNTTGLTATNTITVKLQKAPLTATGAVPASADFTDCAASEIAEGVNAVTLSATAADQIAINHTYVGGTGTNPVFLRHAIVVSGAVTAPVCTLGRTIPGIKPKDQVAGEIGQVIS